jgi:hypothetical protein
MRKATFSDKSTILDLLTISFDGNKSVNYVIKQAGNRVDRIRRLMEYSFDMCNEFGEVWISNDRQACALILFPDLQRTSLHTLLWDLKLAMRVIGVSRIGAILKREAMIKSNHPKKPFAYLWFIRCEPTSTRKGHR